MVMSLQEYVEGYGYKVSDLTEKEIREVEAEMHAVSHGLDVGDGFFGPMSPFTQRMIKGGL